MKFEITWANGSVEEVEQSDCKTVEQFINCRFGSTGTKGCSVVIAGSKKPLVKKAKGDGAVTREE